MTDDDLELVARLTSLFLDGYSFERGRRILRIGRDHYQRLCMAMAKEMVSGMDRRDRGRFLGHLAEWERGAFPEPRLADGPTGTD